MEKIDEEVRKTEEFVRYIMKGANIFELPNEMAAAALGCVMATICLQTELNDPFVSFMNSFTHSYNANYKGPSKMIRSKPFSQDREGNGNK